MIQCLWDCQVYAIIEINLGNTDVDTYKYEPMTPLLARWENIKKDNHSKHCHDQQKHYSLFVISVEIMLEKEALVLISQLSQVMAEKREEPFSQVWGSLNGRITIAVEGYYSRMICRVRVTSPL